ncbi:hypothetical protein [Endothiovibrio diazotrophicus]
MKMRYHAIALLLLAGGAVAGEIPAEVQVNLQNAMHHYLDRVSLDGAYRYVDPKSAERVTLYPANTHPMVLSYNDDYFVCSDLVSENGDSHTADFLVRRFGDDYRVVQMLVDQRAAVEKAMKMAP